MSFDESKCPKETFCAFGMTFDDASVRKERCRFCHKLVSYKKIEGGRIDNAKYLRDHIRDFCQPHGATARIYEQIYGKASVRRHDSLVSMHAKKNDLHETFDEARDILKTMKKTD